VIVGRAALEAPAVVARDFDLALREMRRFCEGSTGKIVGFHGE
jgi:hypothetical protein